MEGWKETENEWKVEGKCSGREKDDNDDDDERERARGKTLFPTWLNENLACQNSNDFRYKFELVENDDDDYDNTS